jgi:pimeloyl-ACP methyl ester carboxylesterase
MHPFRCPRFLVLPLSCAAVGLQEAARAAAKEKLVPSDVTVTVVIVKNSGHWVMEEQPHETTGALARFLH